MKYTKDKRIVLTLDAGGTNFNFSAVQANQEIISPINLSAQGDNLEQVLLTIIDGFEKARARVDKPPVAISFSFPGPADYQQGIIGDLQNLPSFSGGVALKAMLEEKFGIPVYINNDGDLFAYGEALAGFLPVINEKLRENGSVKEYRNLLGVTFGTGFGGGIVTDSNLLFGDNSAGGEINRMRNRFYPSTSIEDSCSIRAIKREFAKEAGIEIETSAEPKEIFEIGMGILPGNQAAAFKSYDMFAQSAGDAMADAITLIDGLVVLGGGIAGAYPLFLPKLVDEMNHNFTSLNGKELSRLEVSVYNLEDEQGLKNFLEDQTVEISVPFSDKKIKYNPEKKIGIGVSTLGTSRAVALGAYAFALNELDKNMGR